VGDRLTEEEKKSKQTSPTPYGDMFDEALPQYLAIGMPYDIFWDGEYGTKKAFRKAYQLRVENEQRIADTNNWYMGQYIAAALQAVPLFVAGFNTKGANLPDYPDKPFFVKHEEQKKEEARKQQQEDQSKLAMAMFQAMTARFNKTMEKKQAESGQ
jgi:hypothetical protein